MMKREAVTKIAVVSLFWGALWGIAEATLGYLAHLISLIPGIAGFIMFPIGFYFSNVVPPDFFMPVGINFGSQYIGDQLGTQADPQNGFIMFDGLPQQPLFRG